VALIAVRVAARPPDDEHAYGHEKAEYFSAGAEGALALIAARSGRSASRDVTDGACGARAESSGSVR
jgi:divalent metal cation (Fe/Co/Zn/Cd) transporter